MSFRSSSILDDQSKICLDVHYGDQEATTAGVVFDLWNDETPKDEKVARIPTPSDYEPGSFYKRELPCLLKLLENLPALPGVILIDGYVWLGLGNPGLGAHLHNALEGKATVIGVAKSPYRDLSAAREVFRGDSHRPLYITVEGMDLGEAACHIQNMKGEHRIPTLIKRADQLARGS